MGITDEKSGTAYADNKTQKIKQWKRRKIHVKTSDLVAFYIKNGA